MSWADATHWLGRRVLVTGAAGFLGQATCGLLQEFGAVVHGTYRSKRPPPDITGHHAFLPDDAMAVIGAAQPSVFIHLASPDRALSQYATLRSGLLDAIAAVASACRPQGARLPHVGTCDVYGDHEAPYSESMAPRPVSPCAARKTAATTWVFSQARTGDLMADVVRPFRATGLSERSSVVSLAARAAVHNADEVTSPHQVSRR